MAYGGDVDRGPFLNIINWVFHAIAFGTVILRVVSHVMRKNKSWGLDDLFIIIALAVNLMRSIYISVAISKGFGRHLEALLEENPHHATELLRLLVILQAIGLWTFTLPKLAVAALLVRLFATLERITVILYSLAVSLLVLALIVTITTFVQCSPVAAQWDLSMADAVLILFIGLTLLAYSASLDFAFALYPILRVSKLHMERSRKIVIASSLSLGFLACIVTIYKLTTIRTINDTQDPTWATIPLEVWNSVEGTTLIIAASTPLIRPVMLIVGQCFQKLASRVSSISWSRSSSPSNGASRQSDGATRKNTDGRNYGHRLSRPHLAMFKPPNHKDDITLLESQCFPNDGEDGRSSSQHRDQHGIYRTVSIQVDGARNSR